MKLEHIILHIGPHKTGSTAIQSTCDYNHVKLEALGILYPRGSEWKTDWHPELGSFFYDDRMDFIHNKERRAQEGREDLALIRREDQIFMDSLKKQVEQSSCRTMIFSYEGFPAIAKIPLLKMRDFLLTLADKITVVAYCRAPLSLVCSAISQLIKTGRSTQLAMEGGVQQYRGFGEMFIEAFGVENVVFRKFSARDMPEGDVVLDFLSFVGLPLEVIKSLNREASEDNSSLSAEAILLGDAILTAHPMPKVANPFTVDFTPILLAIPGQRYTLKSSMAADILERAKPHMDFLSEQCGITFDEENKQVNDDPKLFQDQTIAAIAEQIYSLVMQNKAAQSKIAELEQEIVMLSRQTEKPRVEPRIVTSGALTIIEAKLREGGKIKRGQLINFDVDFFIPNPVQNLEWSIHLQDANGDCAFSISSKSLGQPLQSLTSGSYRVSHHLIADLPSGLYRAGFAFTEVLAEGVRELAWRDAMCEFELALPDSAALGGYASIPAQMSFMTTHLAMPERVVTKGLGAMVLTRPCGNLQIGQRVNVAVAISNRSAQDWLGDVVRPIKLCYHWLKTSGEMYLYDGVRTPIPAGGIAAGATVQAEMQVQAPAESGSYVLVLTLLQERVGWFESIGFETVKLSIEVGV